MRPEIANSLSLLQSRLGDDLDAFALESGDQFDQPVVHKALELKQIAGLHTGGSLALETGAYRFGTTPGASTLAEGSAANPRFGLSLDTSGVVTLIPPTDGILLDAVTTTEPTPVAIGQVIDALTARFELRSGTPTLQRRAESTIESVAPMPASSKGRGVDEAIMEWAASARTAAARLRRRDLVGPAEIKARAEAGFPVILSGRPDHPGFGRVAIGLTDEAFVLPGDRSTLNGATQKFLASLDSLPSVPVEVDLLARSLAIVGPRRLTRPVATWIALAIATDAAADAIGVMVMARANRGDWSWIDALPHEDVAPQSPLELVVIDEADFPTLVAPNGTIVLVEKGKPIPDAIGTVIEIGEAGTAVTDRREGTTTAITPIGVSSMFALEVAFQMAEHLHGGGGRR